jgi:hypothetical protein
MTRDGGARALRREMEDALVVGTARLLARLGPEAERAQLLARVAAPDERTTGTRVVQRGLAIELVGKRARARAHQRSPLDRVTALRRRLTRWCQLSSVEATRADRTRIVSELARAAQRKAAPTEVAGLEQRLGWIGPRIEKVDALRHELEGAEDLALSAYVAEEDLAPILLEAERIARALELALFDVVASWISSDDHEIVLTAVADKRAGLELFVAPLLQLEERPVDGLHLHARAHFPAGVGPPAADWPAERVWGPPREAAVARTLLRGPTRYQHVHLDLWARDAYLSLCHFEGLVRITHEQQRLGVLLGEVDQGPYSATAKLPEITAVPSTAALEIDLDGGRAWIPGDDEVYTFSGRHWPSCLPRLALAAQARSEGL